MSEPHHDITPHRDAGRGGGGGGRAAVPPWLSNVVMGVAEMAIFLISLVLGLLHHDVMIV